MPWCTEHCRPATPPQPKRPRTARRYLPSRPWSRTNNQLMKTKKAITQRRTRASRVLGTTCRDRYPTKRSGTSTNPMKERIRRRLDRARPLPQPPPDTTPSGRPASARSTRSEEHTSELQSLAYLVCRLLREKKKQTRRRRRTARVCQSTPRRTGDGPACLASSFDGVLHLGDSPTPLPCSRSFFFLVLRRPPRSTLFPTRRSSD